MDYQILAKELDPKRVNLQHALLQEKFDGMPIRVLGGEFRAPLSRQNEVITAVRHITDPLYEFLKVAAPNHEVLMELWHPELPQKTIRGLAMRQYEQAPQLVAKIWDCYDHCHKHDGYLKRMFYLKEVFQELKHPQISIVQSYQAEAFGTSIEAAVESFYEHLQETSSYDPEGVVIRSADMPYHIGRTWGFQRWTPKGNLDLRVVSVEERVASKRQYYLGEWFEPGDPMGCVGRFNVRYKNRIVGVGPGKLQARQARHFWEHKDQIVGKIIHVRFKKDDSYEALREARFQSVRDDKTEADY